MHINTVIDKVKSNRHLSIREGILLTSIYINYKEWCIMLHTFFLIYMWEYTISVGRKSENIYIYICMIRICISYIGYIYVWLC